MIDPKEIGKRVRSRRLALDMAQQDLADKAGCTQNDIGRVEKGRHEPTLKRLVQIAQAFGVSVSELLGDDNLTPAAPIPEHVATVLAIGNWAPVPKEEIALLSKLAATVPLTTVLAVELAFIPIRYSQTDEQLEALEALIHRTRATSCNLEDTAPVQPSSIGSPRSSRR